MFALNAGGMLEGGFDMSELGSMTLEHLRLQAGRCERLLCHNASLLGRLADRGARVRELCTAYNNELQRRQEKLLGRGGPLNPMGEGCSRVGRGVGGAGEGDRQRVPSNGGPDVGALRDTKWPELHGIAVLEEERDRHVPYGQLMRRTFGGLLNEQELARRVEGLSPGYFLTLRETCEAQEARLRQRRARELQRVGMASGEVAQPRKAFHETEPSGSDE